MTELEKLRAGLEYDFWDAEVNGQELHAIEGCNHLNSIDHSDEKGKAQALETLFGSVAGEVPAKVIKKIENDLVE